MAILIDYSYLAIHAILSSQFNFKKNSNQQNLMSVGRHAILTAIKNHKTNFKDYGPEVIIAVDSNKGYWRSKVFPYYKGARKKQRTDSDLDWPTIFSIIDTIKAELIEVFPYKVLQIDEAEGDDIIAVMTKWLYNNNVSDKGFFDEPKPILIISNDKDFKQLQVFRNVRQWSITTKAFITADINILNTHIAQGDSKDGIPNVLSEDDVIITEGKRQSRMSKNRLQEFTEKGRDACINDIELRNWDRNNTLINFSKIPEPLEQEIIEAYLNCNPQRDLSRIMDYLIHNKAALFLETIEEF